MTPLARLLQRLDENLFTNLSGSRTTSSFAPRLAAAHIDTNPRPDQRCCPCCTPPCSSKDRHADGGCPIVGHDIDGAA